MRLVLDPAEDAAHGDWLRRTPGAYEWWYLDALSDNGEWALACIWFLGNPFSPYYRLTALGKPADPWEHNGLFFALHRRGRLHSYHFTRFPKPRIEISEKLPGELRFGGNVLTLTDDGCCRLALRDENANCRTLEANLEFSFAPLRLPAAEAEGEEAEAHFWLPAAPACRVAGRIALRERNSYGEEQIAFSGQGYHDHNWGRLPFAAAAKDWYWARASLSPGRTVILYHVRTRGQRNAVSHLLLFDQGNLRLHDAGARVYLSLPAVNGFGMIYATRLTVESGDVRVSFSMRSRLDSAPFYLRLLCDVVVTQGTKTETGQGIGEYFRPGILSWPLVASAMKARITEA